MYDVELRALALDVLDGSGGCVAAAARALGLPPPPPRHAPRPHVKSSETTSRDARPWEAGISR